MEKVIRGKVFVAGDNIDTDQIIPAKYLSYNPSIAEERKFFGKFAMKPFLSQGVYLAAVALKDFSWVEAHYDGLVKGTTCTFDSSFDSSSELHYLAKKNTSSDGKSYDVVLVEETVQ